MSIANIPHIIIEMKIKTKVEVRENEIVVDKNVEGNIVACCSIENKGFFYLVDFPETKYPILVKVDDVIVLKSETATANSESQQIDKSEEEFKERKRKERKHSKKK